MSLNLRKTSANALSILSSDVMNRATSFVLYALVARHLGAHALHRLCQCARESREGWRHLPAALDQSRSLHGDFGSPRLSFLHRGCRIVDSASEIFHRACAD